MPFIDCGPAAQSKTVKMSGYQGKKNIPRITVSLGFIQTLQWLSSCSVWPPGPAGCHRGGEDHAPRPHPPLRSSAVLSPELKGLQLTQQLSSCIIRCILLFVFFFWRDQTFLETSQSIGWGRNLTVICSILPTVLRSNSFSFFFFPFPPLLVTSSSDLSSCLSGFVCGPSVSELSGRWSLLGGVFRSPVSLHNNWWSKCFPASGSIFSTSCFTLECKCMYNLCFRGTGTYKSTLSVSLRGRLQFYPALHWCWCANGKWREEEGGDGWGSQGGERTVIPVPSQRCNEGKSWSGGRLLSPWLEGKENLKISLICKKEPSNSDWNI